MTEHDTRRAARATQVGFLVLLLACTAQLAYWMADEYRFTESVRDSRREAYEAEALSAAAMIRAGVQWSAIAARACPSSISAADGTPRVSAGALERLDADRFHRMNRYGWEGAFFLAVLVAAIGMVYAALRKERERMHAILAQRAREDGLAVEPVLRFGGSEFNLRTHHARSADGAEQLLSEKEAILLKTLADRAGEVVLRDDILEEVWGDEVRPSSRTVDGFVVRLRKRFEPNPERPRFIHTVRGVGYRFTATAEPPQG